MAFGMPYFGDLLARKYAIMQQQADADTARAASFGLTSRADANLSNVRAGLLPNESIANNRLTAAQAAAATATAGKTTEETKFIGPLARASIRNSDAQAGLYGSQADAEDQITKTTAFQFRGVPQRSSVLDFLRTGLRFGLGPFGN